MSGVSYSSLPLESRRSTVGASDIPCILGLSKWATVEDIWNDKLGNVRERQGWAEKYAEWGKRMEPVIIQKYREEHSGLEGFNAITVVANNKSFLYPGHPFSCTPDALCYDVPSGIEFGLEVKNRGLTAKKEWEKGVEITVAAQCQWSMGVMNYEGWDVAVLFGGNTYWEYSLASNHEALALMRLAGEEFMDDVAANSVPDQEFYSDMGRKVANLLRGT